MVLWMKVTDDEYELPLAVADTASELARMCGLNKNGVLVAISNAKRRKTKCQYVKVVIDDEDQEDDS